MADMLSDPENPAAENRFLERRINSGPADHPILRGLGEDAATRFMIGCDEEFHASDGSFWNALIIPTGANGHAAANTVETHIFKILAHKIFIFAA
jgi:hypothetical protein